MRTQLTAAAVLIALLPAAAPALETEELLALVAMPLAVAAVAEIDGVPPAELASLVMLMNEGEVPPTQFIDVIRYVPAALVAESGQPAFVDYVRQERLRGVGGDALVTVIADRLRDYEVEPQIVRRRQPAVIVVDENFVPASVRTVVARRRGHPHGGPPGQIKRQIGVQTGAEVVHGSRPGRGDVPSTVVIETTRNDKRGKGTPPGQAKKASGKKGKGKGKGRD